MESGSFLDLTGAQAASTNLNFASLAINNGTNLLQVRQKTTTSRIMCVTDIITGHRAFSTYFTTLCHGYTSVKRGALYVIALEHTSKKCTLLATHNLPASVSHKLSGLRVATEVMIDAKIEALQDTRIMKMENLMGLIKCHILYIQKNQRVY
jgi:hypothetical protein